MRAGFVLASLLVVLIAVLPTSVLVHGDDLRLDYLEWALQNSTRPPWMPPLEDYRSLVESFINVSECQARINYVAVFYNAVSLYNSSLRLWANYVKVFDLLGGGTAAVLINELGWNNADFSIRLDISRYGYPLLYFMLDEDLYDQGFLYGILFIRINETHVYNFTAFQNDLVSNPGKWFNPRDYAVYCPLRSGSPTRTVTVTETITQATTIPLTMSFTVTETATSALRETITKTETLTHSYSVTVTETITEKLVETSVVEKTIERTKTVTETQTLLSTITEPSTTTVTVIEAKSYAEVFIPALIIALVALTIGWFIKKK